MNDATVHNLVATYLFPSLIVFTVVCLYVFGLRPMLKQTPGIRELYDLEGSAYAALGSKFSGLKQKIATLVISGASALVLMHDQIAPLVTQAGVDPSQLLPQVPPYVWPILTMVVLGLIQYFRNIADKQAKANAEALLNAGYRLAAPAPGISPAVVQATVDAAPVPASPNLPDKKDA